MMVMMIIIMMMMMIMMMIPFDGRQCIVYDATEVF